MTFLYHTSAVDSTGAELNPSCATQIKWSLTPEQNLPDQCVKDTALGYMVHCYCQLTEKNIPITDWAPSASLLTLPGFARAQKADLSLERQCAREGLSRDSICLQEGKGNTSMSRAEKTLASVLCSALGPSECVIFP